MDVERSLFLSFPHLMSPPRGLTSTFLSHNQNFSTWLLNTGDTQLLFKATTVTSHHHMFLLLLKATVSSHHTFSYHFVPQATRQRSKY